MIVKSRAQNLLIAAMKNKLFFGRQIFKTRWFVITLLSLFLFLLFQYGNTIYQNYKVQQQIESLESEVASLEKKKIESLEILRYVTTPVFVEDTARVELNMQKPGERVVIIDDKFIATTTSTLAQNSPPPLHNPMKWWYYFTHKPQYK